MQASVWITNQVAANQFLTIATYVAAHLLIVIPALTPFVLWWTPAQRQRTGMRRAIVLVGLTVASSLALKAGIDFLYQRLRPFQENPDLLHMLIPAAGNSFPSGHTLIGAAISFGFFVGGKPRIGWWLLACTVLVALGRVAAGVHYTTDVLASLAIAGAIALAMRHEASGLRHYLPAQ